VQWPEVDLIIFVYRQQGVESDADCCEQLAEICKEAIHKHNGCPVKKALDIMCSVGRFSYELSKSLSEVTTKSLLV